MDELNKLLHKWAKYEAEKEEEKHPHEKITGRAAQCVYCGRLANSRESLDFFKARPDRKYDEYYCGCYGWD